MQSNRQSNRTVSGEEPSMNRAAVAAGVVAVVVAGGIALAFAPTRLLGPADPASPTPEPSPEPSATPGAQVDADAQFDTTAQHEAVLLPARADALLTGSTELESGSTVTVHVDSTSDDGFETAKEVLVLQDGTFGAVVNLRNVEPTTTLRTTVSYNETVLANETVRVTGPNGTHFHVEGERISLENATGQRVRGATNLDAGTNVSVRLRSTDNNPFIHSRTVTVGDNGTFVATFDLSQVPAGTEFTATVSHASDTVHRSGIVED